MSNFSHSFPVLKEVLCPLHKKKIIKLNLNKKCEDNQRLYCEECKAQNQDFVYNYEDIFKKLKKPSKLPNICGKSYFDEIQIVQSQLFEYIQNIINRIQSLSNFVLHNPIDEDLKYKIFHPDSIFQYQDLVNLTKQLSQEITDKNNKIQFKDCNPDHLKQLEKINQSIFALKICAKTLDEIMNQQSPTSNFLNFINPTVDQNTVQNVEYKLLMEQEISFQNSKILLELNGYHICIGAANDQQSDGKYIIDIFDIDLAKKQFKLNKKLIGHTYKVLILYKHCQFFSVDEGRQIFAWNKCIASQHWFFSKKFDASTLMKQITCIACNHMTNQLILGVDILLAWDVYDKNNYQILKNWSNMNDQGQCVNITENQKILVSGSNQGNISVYSYSQKNWENIFDVQLFHSEVRSLIIISKTDFISIQYGNHWVKWKYNKQLNDYENTIMNIEDLDNSLIFKRTLVKPIISETNGEQKFIQFDNYSNNLDQQGQYIAIVKNNILQLYAVREILQQ